MNESNTATETRSIKEILSDIDKKLDYLIDIKRDERKRSLTIYDPLFDHDLE